jgi:nucleotide-binding universal stress UspA family protein
MTRALLAEANALGANLLVMGAYGDPGESLFRFGRATEKVATAAKVPVLFSH